MAASPAYCKALVQRLRGSSSQAYAAAKLAALVRGDPAAAEAAVAAGAIPALLQLLKRGGTAHSAAVRGQAARALASLCLNKPARLRQVLQAGGVDALLSLLTGGSPDASQLAAGILASMASKLPEERQQLGAAALMPLLSLARASEDPPVVEAALVALVDLSNGCPPNQTALAAAGAATDLVALLNSGGSAGGASSSPKMLALTALALSHVVLGNAEAARAEVVANGGPAALCQCLQHSNRFVQGSAAAAVKNLCCNSPPSKVAVAVAGVVPAVVRLLASPYEEVRGMAAGVLCNLTDADSKPVQQACSRAGAAAALLRLLSSSSTSSADAQEEAVTALNQLAGRHAAHRRASVAHPGSIDALQQLLLSSAATPATVEQTLNALRHLTLDDGAAAVVGTVPAVLRCVGSPHPKVSTHAASLLADLARYNTSARQAIVAAGGVAALAAAARRSEGLTPAAVATANALRCIVTGNRPAAAAAVRALGVPPGASCEQAIIELYVTGQSLPPELFGLPPVLPGMAAMCFPPQASSYRDVSPEVLMSAGHTPTPLCAAEGCTNIQGLRKCGGCGSVRYCSEACSRAHWRAHRAECRRLQVQAEAAAAAPASS